jgi:hypothetical protein
VLQYRAEFDATVVFSNGGGLHAQGFRVDVPHADPTASVKRTSRGSEYERPSWVRNTSAHTTSVLFSTAWTNCPPSSVIGAPSPARGGAAVSVGTPPVSTAKGSPPSR